MNSSITLGRHCNLWSLPQSPGFELHRYLGQWPLQQPLGWGAPLLSLWPLSQILDWATPLPRVGMCYEEEARQMDFLVFHKLCSIHRLNPRRELTIGGLLPLHREPLCMPHISRFPKILHFLFSMHISLFLLHFYLSHHVFSAPTFFTSLLPVPKGKMIAILRRREYMWNCLQPKCSNYNEITVKNLNVFKLLLNVCYNNNMENAKNLVYKNSVIHAYFHLKLESKGKYVFFYGLNILKCLVN
jgi:hypothetical protein